MRTLYFLLTRSETSISKAISLATSDPYTHISLAFDNSLDTLYTFCRKYEYFPLPAGLTTESINRGYLKKHEHINCAVYCLDVEDEIYEAVYDRVMGMMENKDYYRYNVMGLISIKFNIPLKRERHYFCSQFVSEILEESNALVLPKHTGLIRPYDYTTFDSLSCLYTGTLKDLAI